jgi:Ca-activated chloride channel homolog
MGRLAICLALSLLSCATQSNDPNLVELTAALQNPFVQAKQAQELIARIRVGTHPLNEEIRRPIHLALVIDTSGSMEGDAIANARAAAIELVEALSSGDRISVIAFHSTTDVIAPSTEIDTGSKLLLKKKLEALEAKGTTDLAGGLRAAIDQLAVQREGEIRRVVLLSDGIPNDPTQILPLADSLATLAPVTALGLGLEFDEALLASIAQRTGGKFHFVEDSKLVASVFREEVLRLDRAVAKNAILQLTPGPGVTIAAVIGRAPVAVGRGLEIPLGDIGEDEIRDVLVRLDVSARAESASVELMDAVLWFEDATDRGAGRYERRLFLSAKSTADAKKISEAENEEVARAYAKQGAAALTIEALNEARLGNVSGSQAILQQAEQVTRENAAKYGDSELQRALVDIIELQKGRDERTNKRVYDKSMQLIY